MSDLPRVLFVSKPVVPPWHDGSKNLVRDVAGSLKSFRPTVLTTLGADTREVHGAQSWPIYESTGSFAPALSANARVLSALTRARDFAIWHFVFAPNIASSTAARVAIAAGRSRDLRRVVQTIASRPKRFGGVARLLFGDAIVALSEWTRGRLLAEGVSGKKLTVIPPCARPLRDLAEGEVAALREAIDVERNAPLVVYAGDLEVSSGAETTALAASTIVKQIPEARVVFACRKKTKNAYAAEDALRAELARRNLSHATRFVGELPDLAVLLRQAMVLVFPVDDLYGKVDVPLVVLEALASGIPMVLARGGPLESVTSARFVEPRDSDALAAEVVTLLQNESARRTQLEAGKALYQRTFSPEVVAAKYEEVYRGRPDDLR